MNDYRHHAREAATRYGLYLSEIERKLLLRAHDLAGEPGLALDVGAAGGRWSTMLHERGWRNICTDVNEVSVARLKEVLPDAECHLVDPDDHRLPADTASVGMVLCIEVFLVMPMPWFTAECARVIKPGGLLVGEFNNRRSWRGLLHRVATRLKGGFDYYQASYPRWKSALREAGFEIEYEEGASWLPLGRRSNSGLVPALAAMERGLGLKNLPDFSPTVAFVARKIR